jgi:hypothetical protein
MLTELFLRELLRDIALLTTDMEAEGEGIQTRVLDSFLSAQFNPQMDRELDELVFCEFLDAICRYKGLNACVWPLVIPDECMCACSQSCNHTIISSSWPRRGRL